jgi:hypothetical protein
MRAGGVAALAVMAALLGPGLAVAQVGGVPPVPADVAPPAPAAPEGRPPTRVLAPPPVPDLRAEVDAAVGRFRAVYAHRGAPRLALFWNRDLGDQLSRWETRRRHVVTGRGDAEWQEAGKEPGRSAVSSEAIASEQRLSPDARRRGPGERLEWELQDGFLDPLMRAGVRVIDRATIIRIVGARESARGRPGESPEPQSVELVALQGFADILLEILLAPAPETDDGLEIRAVAKEIATGAIVTQVSTRTMRRSVRTGTQYVATPRGFEPRPVPTILQDLTTQLSLALMDSLAARWSR